MSQILNENITVIQQEHDRSLTFHGNIGFWGLGSNMPLSNDTNPFEYSPSDNEIEREKTSERLSPFLKNNVLSQTPIRVQNESLSEYFLPSSNVIDSRSPSMIFVSDTSFFIPFTKWINFKEELGNFFPQRGFSQAERVNPLTETLMNITTKFIISNEDSLKEFFLDIKKTNPKILDDLQTVSNFIGVSLSQQGIEFSGKVEEEYDYDDERRKNVRFTLQIEKADVKTCLELSKNLVTSIAEQNKEFLKNIHIKVISK